jgi:hypothetical protein
MKRSNAACGAGSWLEALDWLETVQAPHRIGEIQFWGHGKWGEVLVNGQVLDRTALRPEHPLYSRLIAIRQRLVPDGQALWWFRTCETFGARPGHIFAEEWSSFFGCRCAGHTHIIGYYQSGLHCLRSLARPHWPVEEGILVGTPDHPEQAANSNRTAPNTITCLHGQVPPGF